VRPGPGERIRCASVWEDADLLCEALSPVARGGRLLSVAAAGDNALALLTLDPAEVLAVDSSPAPLACLELRLVAIRRLADDALLAFLGVTPSTDRAAVYRLLRRELAEGARDFWDAHPAAMEEGVIHAGSVERSLRAFRRWVLPLVHTRRALHALREERTPEERLRFYRLFFSRAVMGRLGRDAVLPDPVDGTAGERFLERTRHALTELPTHSNPYLAYALTGNYAAGALPRYLRPESIPVIRERLGRLSWIRGGVEAAPGRFDGFNLSDLFEPLGPAEHERVYGELLARSRPGARLVYWNLLAARARPEAFRDRARPLAELAARLHREDRAWFYQTLRVDEVLP
jgi:S-adenosylmethionine-diacylglycerol 3-amino-3-carboxypropyl transferase